MLQLKVTVWLINRRAERSVSSWQSTSFLPAKLDVPVNFPAEELVVSLV